jgi:hypothetical protein
MLIYGWNLEMTVPMALAVVATLGYLISRDSWSTA